MKTRHEYQTGLVGFAKKKNKVKVVGCSIENKNFNVSFVKENRRKSVRCNQDICTSKSLDIERKIYSLV